jgi:hypothetical protein
LRKEKRVLPEVMEVAEFPFHAQRMNIRGKWAGWGFPVKWAAPRLGK